MFRQGADTNLKWMFTISLLFHLVILSGIFLSNIFKMYDLSTARYAPLTAIHVNIISLPEESPSVIPGVPKVERGKEEKLKIQEVQKKDRAEAVKKVEKLGEAKSVQSAKVPILEPMKNEPMKNEKVEEVTPTPPHKGGGSKDDSRDRPSGLSADAEGKEQAASAQEARLVPDGPMVSGPVVNIPSFKYDYYLGLIKNKVDNRWTQPVAYNRVRQTLIEFIVHRNGKIIDVRIAESSGDHYFDQSALRAVNLSNPFPPLPLGYKEDSLKVYYRFIFGGKGG